MRILKTLSTSDILFLCNQSFHSVFNFNFTHNPYFLFEIEVILDSIYRSRNKISYCLMPRLTFLLRVD